MVTKTEAGLDVKRVPTMTIIAARIDLASNALISLASRERIPIEAAVEAENLTEGQNNSLPDPTMGVHKNRHRELMDDQAWA